ncbi:MAG: hypothetical protein WBW62_11670 [Solirubrobacterales bacterium]
MKKSLKPGPLAIILSIAIFGLAACGGNSDSSGDARAAEAAGQTGGRGGGPLVDLDESQIACLEDEGFELPERTTGGEAPGGQPPMPGEVPGERPAAPEGTPDMGDMQSAMEACGIDLPAPPTNGVPEGSAAPGPLGSQDESTSATQAEVTQA